MRKKTTTDSAEPTTGESAETVTDLQTSASATAKAPKMDRPPHPMSRTSATRHSGGAYVIGDDGVLRPAEG